MNLVEYPDREMMMIDLANVLAGELNTALMREERALLVVPGGTTPGPVFDFLCAAELDWDRVVVLLSDERWLPENSRRSNTRLLRERLLVGPAARATFLPLYAPTDQPEDSLEQLSAAIGDHLPIAVSLLGMGADMHTASLFPGADRLREALANNAPTLVAMRAPTAPEPRVTLSARILNEALAKHVVIVGEQKRQALEEARQTSDRMLAPITAVWQGATVHWAA
jgi:6-phosphogluconolactonase